MTDPKGTTPRPRGWTREKEFILDDKGRTIVCCAGDTAYSTVQDIERAEFIMDAVNAHDAVTEEARELRGENGDLRAAPTSAEVLLETLSVALLSTNAVRARQAGVEAIRARAALARGGR